MGFLAVYRGQADPDRASSVIIGRTIMYYCFMWLDETRYVHRTWYWVFGNYSFIFMLSFTFGTFLLGLPNHLSTISDFGGWLNITAGSVIALFKAAFVSFYRVEITAALDIVAGLDAKLKQKATTDLEIRRRRTTYFVVETLLIYSSLAFTVLMAVAVFGQGLTNSPKTLFPLTTTPMGFGETPIGFWVTFLFNGFGCVWGGGVMVSVDLMVGNAFNQLILNVQVMIHELRELGGDSKALEMNEKVAEDKEKEKALIRIVQEYQYLRVALQKLNGNFQLLLFGVVLSNMFVLTMVSIELAFVIYEGFEMSLRPGMYFIFMNTAFFYWCWLGQRLSDLARHVPRAVFDFDWGCGGVRFKKLRLMVMQMTGQPMQIVAKPFFVLNYGLFLMVLRRAYSIMAVLKDVASAKN